MQHRVQGDSGGNFKAVLIVLAAVFSLAVVSPALAGYLGPNRTVTQVTNVCKIYLNECMYVPSKDDWRYKGQYGWECSNESKPWLAYRNSPLSVGCYEGVAGDTYWSKEDVIEEVTITHPPASIGASLQNCNANNGWCNTAPELSLSGAEPLAGHSILAIEGSLNGQTFACSGPTCVVPLDEGDNNFSFWALSSWGDSSEAGTFTAKVDTVPPSLNLNISGSNGTNGWYVSPAVLTAAGNDSTSGLAHASLSVDGGAWVSSITLQEGVYNVDAQAQDRAGNISTASTTISVDTTTPALNLSLNGAKGKNGWFTSTVDVTSSASDAIAGIALLEVSVNGGSYAGYGSPINFGDGQHSVQFRASDNAGNVIETPPQSVSVDTSAPVVNLPASWTINETANYSVHDSISGLADLRILIEDGNGQVVKALSTGPVSGADSSGGVLWNGIANDGTEAPPGDYKAWLKVADKAGNETIAMAIVTVPAPFSQIQSNAAGVPEDSPRMFTSIPRELFEEEPITPEFDASPYLTFGGSTVQAGEAEIRSLSLSTGSRAEGEAVKRSLASSASGRVAVWGAAAVAIVGAATAYALEEKRKRDEESARQRAEIEALIAEKQAKRDAAEQARKAAEWLEGKAVLDAQIREARKHGATEEQISALKKLGREQGLGEAIKKSELLTQNLAYRDAAILQARDQRMENKMQSLETIDDAKWTASQIAIRKRAEEAANAELQSALAAYYSAMRQSKEVERETISLQESWWQKTWSGIKEGTDKVVQWVDQHQTEIAIGIGVVAGIALVVLTAGSSVPFLVAATSAMWVAGGVAAFGTVAVNAYQGRPLAQNVFKNAITAAVSAFATTGILSFFVAGITTLGNSVAGYCAVNQVVCGRADSVMNALDVLEEVGLYAKGGIQSLRGDSQGAADTMLELQMEHLDGGIPGNVIANQIRDLGEDGIQIVAAYGDDAIPLLLKHGNDAVDIIGVYGDEGVFLLQLYGDDAVRLIRDYGTPAVNVLKILDAKSAHTLLKNLDEDVLDYAINQGPDAVAALSRWDETDLAEFGPELALRAKKDAEVLKDIKKLIASGPVDPKHLTSEQKELIDTIAENSIQYNDEGQIVLGKWIDYSNGFTRYARETGSAHYNPHPDMWKLLGELGNNREETAWLVNKQVIQQGIDRGLPFEYTLDGVPANDIFTEKRAIQLIFSGATESEIIQTLGLEKISIRMKELEELQKAGYEFVFDEINNSFILDIP